jgi:hypothetical protein
MVPAAFGREPGGIVATQMNVAEMEGLEAAPVPHRSESWMHGTFTEQLLTPLTHSARFE